MSDDEDADVRGLCGQIEKLKEENARLLRANEILIAQRDELRRIFEPASPLACINPSDINVPLRGGMVRVREASNAIDDGPGF